MHCALVDSQGIVVNFIVADPAVDQPPIFGGVIVADPSGNAVFGARWNGTSFSNPTNIRLPGQPGSMEFL